MTRPGLLACALCSFLLLVVQRALAVYDPTHIVANVTSDCPIPNSKWSPAEYQLSTLITVFTPLVGSIARQDCQQQAQSLSVCALDGSLEVKTGCCSSDCAAQMNKLSQLACFPIVLSVLCNATADQATQAQSIAPVLVSAAQRCANYRPPPAITCPDGRIIPVGTDASALAGAGAPAAEAPMPEGGPAGADALPGAVPGAGP